MDWHLELESCLIGCQLKEVLSCELHCMYSTLKEPCGPTADQISNTDWVIKVRATVPGVKEKVSMP